VIGRKSQRKGEDKNMEEHRCRMAAAATDDCRCKNLLDSAMTGMEDPRYKSLHRHVDIEVEDPRCNYVVMEMEDPRCEGLSLKW
jgi:hypothetical protein